MLSRMTDKAEPYELVEVKIANSDYRNVCVTYGGGFELEDKWLSLANYLVGRPGWHFDLHDGQVFWNLGDFGGSTLNISAVAGGFNCYNASNDESFVLTDISQVSEWLEPIEVNNRHAQAELAASFNWAILKSHNFVVRVDTLDDRYCATIADITSEIVFGDSLSELVEATRQQILDYFGAPSDLSHELVVSLHLNGLAVRLTQIREL